MQPISSGRSVQADHFDRISLTGSVRSERNDACCLAAMLTLHRELYLPVDQRIQRVILAEADVVARMDPRSALADDDAAGRDRLAAKGLHAEALRLRVAAVARGAACF